VELYFLCKILDTYVVYEDASNLMDKMTI